MQQLVIRGVPASLANDGWWLADEPLRPGPNSPRGTTEPSEAPRDAHQRAVVLLLLLALVLLADLLFWDHKTGISLIVFNAALSAAALIGLRPDLSKTQWVAFAGAWTILALPVVEYVQLTSVVFLLLGHLTLIIWVATRAQAGGLVRFLMLAPVTLVRIAIHQLSHTLRHIRRTRGMAPKQAALMNWVVPAIAGAWFMILFFDANPLFGQWLDRATDVEITDDSALRILFWAVMALMAVPFVWFHHFEHLSRKAALPKLEMPEGSAAILNAPAIINSLFVFNLMFLAQNATDLTFLWGGAQLPDGVTYADYAQNGAYPLLATSILAGLFVLFASQYAQRSGAIRALLLLWIVQNLVLVTSALGRLDLYVDAYGLTYLRLRAGIGMCVVAAGMVLLGVQLWKGKTNTWTTAVFSALCGAILYGACFVNFANVIATENLSREARKIDDYYLCTYLRDGVEAILDHAQRSTAPLCRHEFAKRPHGPDNWQEWTMRDSRLTQAKADYVTLVWGTP